MNWMRQFGSLKLNIKFTLVIILFMVIPIGVLASVLFYNMEQNVIDENVNYMQYTMERNKDALSTKMDSINMSTQLFLSDSALLDILKNTQEGKKYSAEEWYALKSGDITSLERLVNNNPLLYGVRVYATNDNIQEVMPVLYNSSRMKKQVWAKADDPSGWHFNYTDNLFSSYTMDQNRKIVSLVTQIDDRNYETIGTIEAAMTMENMFPSLYEVIENEWSCFADADGSYYFGDETQEKPELLEDVMHIVDKDDNIQTSYVKIKGKNLVVSSFYVRELEGMLVCVRDITKNVHGVYYQRNMFVFIMVVFLIVLAFFINAIVKHMLKKLYEILRGIRRVQGGDLDVVIKDCGNDEMGELGTQINKMLSRIKELMEDNLSREMLAKNSEIRALQNQINAHFIYNVLESIKMMAEIDEEYEISDAVTALGKLLRYSMKWVSGNVLVEQELDYIKNYMALINLRFDYEIFLSLNIPDIILKQEIPKMSLQPIVENAICHGIEQMAEDTNIYVKGIVEENDCVIEITDAGRGMTEEEVERLKLKIAGKIDSGGGSGNGIGLKNVQDRIHIAFGEKYGIEVASKIGCYTKVIVRIPMTHKEKEKQLEMENGR
jgi:two-component system sensor histidine kinase YesM